MLVGVFAAGWTRLGTAGWDWGIWWRAVEAIGTSGALLLLAAQWRHQLIEKEAEFALLVEVAIDVVRPINFTHPTADPADRMVYAIAYNVLNRGAETA